VAGIAGSWGIRRDNRVGSKVIGLKAGPPANAGEHFRTNLITLMECKNLIGPAVAFQHTMGATLPLDFPTNLEKRGQDELGSG
jgi:hypothetical protein